MKTVGLRLPDLPKAFALFDTATATRLLGMLVSVAAILLAAWWLTRLAAPRPVANLPSAAVAIPGSSLATVSRLFGGGQVNAQALEGVQLTGVYIGGRGGGFATFQTRKGAVSALVGAEISPGVSLVGIEPDRVFVSDHGVRKELPLRKTGGATVPSASLAQPQVQSVIAQRLAEQVAIAQGKAAQGSPNETSPGQVVGAKPASEQEGRD